MRCRACPGHPRLTRSHLLAVCVATREARVCLRRRLLSCLPVVDNVEAPAHGFRRRVMEGLSPEGEVRVAPGSACVDECRAAWCTWWLGGAAPGPGVSPGPDVAPFAHRPSGAVPGLDRSTAMAVYSAIGLFAQAVVLAARGLAV